MNRYYKRPWNDTRGDEYDAWGGSLWYLEIGQDQYPIRQMEVYENGNRLKYHPDKPFDDYGGLGTQPLDVNDFQDFEIKKSEFEREWAKVNPKKEHREILNLIAAYLAEHYDQRFGQALFNLGINEFTENPSHSMNLRLRDIHEDTDDQILQRIKERLKSISQRAESDGLRISLAEWDDLMPILILQKEAYRQEAEIYQDFNIPPLTQTLDALRLEWQTGIVLKAVKEGQLAGSVRAALAGNTCKIGKLIVKPAFQNQGIGTQLMYEIERLFDNCTVYEFFTGSKSDKNLAVYQKLGYRIQKSERVTENLELIYLQKQNPSSD